MKATCSGYPRTVLVLGPSGSGKDTQIDKLAALCGYEKIGTGDMFRREYEKKTPEGIEAYSYWSKGVWVPDELVYSIFSIWMKQYDPEKPWIFSQVVRAPGQVGLFDDLLKTYGRSLDAVVLFALSEEAAIERMSLRRHCPKCGREYHLKYVPPKKGEVCDDDGEDLVSRDDDTPDSIRQRLREFNGKTRPVIDAYTARGLLVEVDASPPIEMVWQGTRKALDTWREEHS
ncbi:MAG: nucleoside monophosphate kinase [Candidatus Dojkabacteria bacterium]|nr:nucleoside monophosphate kinase [Candidatus Dojkabacteria bacterium]